MPRNGSGVYSKPAGTTAVPNTKIESAKFNAVVDDFVQDANAARPITAGGTGATSAADARSNLGLTTGTFGFLYGLTLSNNATDAANDIDIAAGTAAEQGVAAPSLMTSASALTKRLDASWAVGSGNGGLDTGVKAGSTCYHVWLIERSDTGVVDALFSTSATSPTMPANYDKKRRIGAVLTDSGGSIRQFTQIGDMFLTAFITDVNVTNQPASGVLRALSVPTGVSVVALVRVRFTSGSVAVWLFTSPQETDAVPDTSSGLVDGVNPAGGSEYVRLGIATNTSGQIRSRSTVASSTLIINTYGWIDRRGRDS